MKMKILIILFIIRNTIQQTSEAEQKFENDETEDGRNVAKAIGKENVFKLVGFDNLDVRYEGEEKDNEREVIDKDTPLMILPPKPVIVMPQFIVPKKRAAKFRMVNQWYII